MVTVPAQERRSSPVDPARVEAVLELEDPSERARQLTQLLEEAQKWVERLSDHRQVAVLGMRSSGATYQKVAEALGISKSRAQQLCTRTPAG